MREFLQFYNGFKKGMRGFGQNIALVINAILLSLVYSIGVGLTSIAARLFGKHFLEMKLSKGETYWSELNLRKKKIDDYYRQF